MLQKFQITNIWPPVRRCFRLVHSGRNSRDTAEMPDVSGSIRCGLDWNRAFTLSCDAIASVASDSECRIDSIYGGEEYPSHHSQIWLVVKIIRGQYVKRQQSIQRLFGGRHSKGEKVLC